MPVAYDAANWQYTVGSALSIQDFGLAEDIVQMAVALKVEDRTLSMMRRMITRAKGKK